MPQFEVYSFVKWLHVLTVALGGGSAMIILILVGFEDGREDLKGMTSILWKRTAAWAFRLAVVFGIVLLTLVVLLLLSSELSGKSLARARRGAAMLAFLLFLVVTFVSVNKDAFGWVKHPSAGGPFTGAVEKGAE